MEANIEVVRGSKGEPTILRVKRKRSEHPLDALVVEYGVSKGRKKRQKEVEELGQEFEKLSTRKRKLLPLLSSPSLQPPLKRKRLFRLRKRKLRRQDLADNSHPSLPLPPALSSPPIPSPFLDLVSDYLLSQKEKECESEWEYEYDEYEVDRKVTQEDLQQTPHKIIEISYDPENLPLWEPEYSDDDPRFSDDSNDPENSEFSYPEELSRSSLTSSSEGYGTEEEEYNETAYEGREGRDGDPFQPLLSPSQLSQLNTDFEFFNSWPNRDKH